MLDKDLSNRSFLPPSIPVASSSKNPIASYLLSRPFSFPGSPFSFMSAPLFTELELKGKAMLLPLDDDANTSAKNEKKRSVSTLSSSFQHQFCHSKHHTLLKKIELVLIGTAMSVPDPIGIKLGWLGRRLEVGFGVPHPSQVPKSQWDGRDGAHPAGT